MSAGNTIGDLNINLVLTVNGMQQGIAQANTNLKGVEAQGKKTGESVNKSFTETGKGAVNMAKNVVGAIAAFEGFQKVKGFIVEAVQQFLKVEDANVRLKASVNNDEKAYNSLLIAAKKFSSVTIYTASQIKEAMSFLAINGRTEDQVKKTTQAALDYAAVTGKDLQTATMELNGTYEGVIGRLGKLDKGFGELTMEQLQNGAAIDLIEKKYKGMAETMGNTTTGKIAILEKQLSSLKTAFGQGIVEGITDVTGKLNVMGGSMTNNQKTIDYLKEAIVGLVAGYIKFGGGLNLAIQFLGRLTPILIEVVTRSKNVARGVLEMIKANTGLVSSIPLVGKYFNAAKEKANEYLDKLLQIISAQKNLNPGGAFKRYGQTEYQGKAREPEAHSGTPSNNDSGGSTKEKENAVDKLIAKIETEVRYNELNKTLNDTILDSEILQLQQQLAITSEQEDQVKLLEEIAALQDKLQKHDASKLNAESDRTPINAQSGVPGYNDKNREHAQQGVDPQTDAKRKQALQDVNTIISATITMVGILGIGADTFVGKLLSGMQQAISFASSIMQIISAVASISSGGGLFSLLGFATGGFTGEGGKYEAAGIVHKGEYVVPAYMRRIFPWLEMMRTSAGGGSSYGGSYSTGGYVTPGGYGSGEIQLHVNGEHVTDTMLGNWFRRGFVVNEMKIKRTSM